MSNLDVDDLEELLAVPGGSACATDQVLYNPGARGVEWALLPWCRERGMPVMAYSPVGQGGRLLKDAALRSVTRRHGNGVTPAQVALAWALRQPGMIVIPKASAPAPGPANAAVGARRLSDEDLLEIDAAFPPPTRKQPLGVL